MVRLGGADNGKAAALSLFFSRPQIVQKNKVGLGARVGRARSLELQQVLEEGEFLDGQDGHRGRTCYRFSS